MSDILSRMTIETRFLLAALALALNCPAQGPPLHAPEEEVRRVLANVFQAAREGDRELGLKFLSRSARLFSPGGVSMPAPTDAGSRFWSSRKGRATFIRHVEILNADVAVVVGLWRDPGAPPPFDAGIFDYTLVREKGDWRIATLREAFLPAPHSLPSAPGTPTVSTNGVISKEERSLGWQTLFDGKTTNGWLSLSGSREVPSG